MLANNLCDIEDDLANNRYTLPIYIGKDHSLMLFRILYYIIYIIIIILLVLRVVPAVSAITLLTFLPVRKHLKLFGEKQTKKDTFVLAVKNFCSHKYNFCFKYCYLFDYSNKYNEGNENK